MLNGFDFNKFKEFFTDALKDKKKREYLILAALVIFIFIVFLYKNSSANNDIILDNDISTDITVNEESTESLKLYVDISGEVVNPGVYEVDSTTRLFQVINMAGGLTEDADIDSINQAEIVSDGQKIIIGSINSDSTTSSTSSSTGEVNGKISINNADSSTLQTLPGIGETKAQRIIDYRNANGKFKSIEEIKNVSGIGESTYELIKDKICL